MHQVPEPPWTFSLKALFIATTVAGIVFGFVWAFPPPSLFAWECIGIPALFATAIVLLSCGIQWLLVKMPQLVAAAIRHVRRRGA